MDHTETQSFRGSRDVINNIDWSHADADTRFILYASEAVDMGVQLIIMMCRDKNVMFLLVKSTAVAVSEIWRVP